MDVDVIDFPGFLVAGHLSLVQRSGVCLFHVRSLLAPFFSATTTGLFLVVLPKSMRRLYYDAFRCGGVTFTNSRDPETLILKRVGGPTLLNLRDIAWDEEIGVFLTVGGRKVDPRVAFAEPLWPDYRAMYDEWHGMVRQCLGPRDLVDLVYEYAFRVPDRRGRTSRTVSIELSLVPYGLEPMERHCLTATTHVVGDAVGRRRLEQQAIACIHRRGSSRTATAGMEAYNTRYDDLRVVHWSWSDLRWIQALRPTEIFWRVEEIKGEEIDNRYSPAVIHVRHLPARGMRKWLRRRYLLYCSLVANHKAFLRQRKGAPMGRQHPLDVV